MKLRTAFLVTVLALLMSACGPRGSGYAPADNAVTASPNKDIDLQPHDYTLPATEATNDSIRSTYATGDSSGGANYVMSTVDVDALPISTGDGHGDESGHGDEGDHDEESDHSAEADDEHAVEMGEGEHSDEADETEHADDSEAEQHDAEEVGTALESSDEDTAELSETEEGSEEVASEEAKEGDPEEGLDSEDATTEEAAEDEESTEVGTEEIASNLVEASVESLEAVQSRSFELTQQLRELGEEARGDEAQTLRRDLLRTQGDVASLSDARGTYVVQEGDTLNDIAQAFYGDSAGSDAILEANRYLIDDADMIFPGFVLLIPNPDTAASTATMTGETESGAASESSETEETSDESEDSQEETTDSEEDEPEEGEEDTGESDSEASDDTETNSETESSDIQAQGSSFDWQELGESTYTANCVACHQANGEGIPGAFPPLAGHIPNLYNAEGGRDYIIQTVLYGLMGEIEVNGTSYNSAMTPWAQLSDEQIAATLNHELSSWGNDEVLEDFSPILPDEVAALRDQGLSSTDVLELRPEVP